MVSTSSMANAHCTLEFDSTETVVAGTPRKMGFQLLKGKERYAYQGYDDEPTQLINEVQSNGFTIHPKSLEILFKKNNWSGAFGAYLERPGQSRPAFTIGVDHRTPRPTLASKQYLAGVGAGQSAFPARISGAVEFGNALYVCIAGRIVYKMTWAAGTAYFTAVFTHSNVAAILRDLRVYNGYLYVAAGSTAAYAYTADGTTWVESTLGGNIQYAEQFLVLNKTLHKFRTPNLHASSTSPLNGGSWESEDAIGESSSTIQMMLGLNDNILFLKDSGIFNLDSAGNITDIYPELQTLQDSGNGWHSFVWHNHLFYPTLYGELFVLADGVMKSIAPAIQMERALEVTPASDDVFAGRIRAMTGTQDYLFAEIQRASDSLHRILVLQELGGEYVWRTLFDLATTTSDELWITSASTSGPVLWATTATDLSFKAAYWILPAGPDPLQDARLNYAASGYLYEPWLDMGCPTTAKRWDTIDIETYSTAAQSIHVHAINDAGTLGIDETITVGTTPAISTLTYAKGFNAKRSRLIFQLITSTTTVTPVLISYTVRATALPTKVRMFELTVGGPASGPTWGLTTQKEFRLFLLAIRSAVEPLTYVDPFGTSWTVQLLTPTPAETITASGPGTWDEGWHMVLGAA